MLVRVEVSIEKLLYERVGLVSSLFHVKEDSNDRELCRCLILVNNMQLQIILVTIDSMLTWGVIMELQRYKFLAFLAFIIQVHDLILDW